MPLLCLMSDRGLECGNVAAREIDLPAPNVDHGKAGRWRAWRGWRTPPYAVRTCRDELSSRWKQVGRTGQFVHVFTIA